MKVYVLGNPLVVADSMPLRMLPFLKKALPDVEFIEIDPSEEFPIGETMVFMDTVEAAENVTVLEEIGRITDNSRNTLHDYGLGMQLKLMSKLGKLGKVYVICIPMHGSFESALKQAAEKIRQVRASLSSGSDWRSSCRGRKPV